MTYGRCVTCGEPGATRERRPNGNTTCVNGHTHPSAAFDRHADSAYRNKMDGPLESLGVTLLDLGAVTPNGGEEDDAIIEITIKKLKMLHEIASTVMSPALLKAAMAG